ncbi:DUF6578 domain-containing protein [Streptomyces sp. NPDC052107]|uniref:DUF6578 domain-containing protein n=1 Tax=Streptomyces sp. NPDC052107 TaxID=3155632 RepID=UPI003442665D
MRVFYEDWQMECCGTPFAVGDEVSWKLVAYGAEAVREGHGYGAVGVGGEPRRSGCGDRRPGAGHRPGAPGVPGVHRPACPRRPRP